MWDSLASGDTQLVVGTHALIQEGVYSSLLKPKLRELHKRLASWFAERDPVLRAQHLDRANDPEAPQALLEIPYPVRPSAI